MKRPKHVWWVMPNIEYRVVPWSVALSASAVLHFLFEINRNATFCRAAKQQSLFWVILLRKSLQVFYSNQTQLIYLFNKVKSAAAGFGLDKKSADSQVLQLNLNQSWSSSTHRAVFTNFTSSDPLRTEDWVTLGVIDNLDHSYWCFGDFFHVCSSCMSSTS